jgi:hypothetical protein
MSWKGGCQCGAVAFEANGDPAKLMACNCSICRPKGYLHWFVPEADFRLLTDDAALASYEFHKRHLHHRFCRTCGVSPFIQGPGMVAVNARCLPDFDLESVPIEAFDGAAL